MLRQLGFVVLMTTCQLAKLSPTSCHKADTGLVVCSGVVCFGGTTGRKRAATNHGRSSLVRVHASQRQQRATGGPHLYVFTPANVNSPTSSNSRIQFICTNVLQRVKSVTYAYSVNYKELTPFTILV